MGKGRDSVEAIRNAGTGSSPAGGQFEIQFNDGGDFAADVSFGYNSAVKRMYADKIQSADPDAGAAGEFLATFDAAGDLNKSDKTIDDIAPTPAAGNSNEIQYNTGGIFAASSTFKREAITGRIDVPLLRVTGLPLSIDDTQKIVSVTTDGDLKQSSITLAGINNTIRYGFKSQSNVTFFSMSGTELDFLEGAAVKNLIVRATANFSATLAAPNNLNAYVKIYYGPTNFRTSPIMFQGQNANWLATTTLTFYSATGITITQIDLLIQNIDTGLNENCEYMSLGIEAVAL